MLYVKPLRPNPKWEGESEIVPMFTSTMAMFSGASATQRRATSLQGEKHISNETMVIVIRQYDKVFLCIEQNSSNNQARHFLNALAISLLSAITTVGWKNLAADFGTSGSF